MIDALRRSLALRSARRALGARTPAEMRPDPERRVAMVVLPESRVQTEETWDVLDALGLDPDRVIAVAVGAVAYVPDRYAGRILVVTPRGPLRLPSASDRRAAWAGGADVAINLLDAGDPSGALLVGASPSALRIGFADRRAEMFYDLLVGAPGDAEPGPGTVARTLGQIDPTLFRSP